MKTHYYKGNALACNNNMGGASGWEHTRDPKGVTCKNCLRIMRKGSVQLQLEIDNDIKNRHTRNK